VLDSEEHGQAQFDSESAPRNSPSVAVVVVNYNATAVTTACLESVFALDYQNFQVILVDNGSVDGSSEELAGLFPAATVVRSKVNLGIGGGFNLGAGIALRNSFECVWLLHNDMVVEKESLKSMVTILENDPQVVAVMAACFDSRTGSNLAVLVSALNERTGVGIGGTPLDPDRDVYLDFADPFSLFRSEGLRQVGPLNNKYFMGGEETDFCLRTKLAFKSLGWKVVYSPRAKTYHTPAVSANRLVELHPRLTAFLRFRNYAFLALRHVRKKYWGFLIPHLGFAFVGGLVEEALKSFVLRKNLLLLYLAGSVDGLVLGAFPNRSVPNMALSISAKEG
jgi:GT2 family glycosyltransferase